MISRDVVIVLTVAIVNLAIGPRTFEPSIYGKIATATYIVTAVAAMLFNYLGYHSVIVDVGIWASLAITLVSSFHYIWHARAHHRRAGPKRMKRIIVVAAIVIGSPRTCLGFGIVRITLAETAEAAEKIPRDFSACSGTRVQTAHCSQALQPDRVGANAAEAGRRRHERRHVRHRSHAGVGAEPDGAIS